MQRSEISEKPTTVTSVTKVGESSITMEDGWTLGCSLDNVQVGDLVEQWGMGVGFRVRGLAVGGRVDWYRTEAQEKDYNDEQRIIAERKRAVDFEQQRASLDAQFDELPPVLQDRINGFRENGGEQWRIDFESYEMFCSTEAVKIAKWCEDNDMSVSAFKAMSVEDHIVAGIADAHSGNTFGMACHLARSLNDRTRVLNTPGAMSPISGARASGR